MNSFASIFNKDVLRHPLVLISLLAVALIALGSGIYYAVATVSPPTAWATPVHSSITETVTSSGTVEPAQNPDLAFQSGGRVATVNVSVGQKVFRGQLMASLDGSILAAQLAQADATLKGQQAKLAALQAGPRSVDIAAKKTAILQAELTLSNLYASIPAILGEAYDKSFSGVSASTDTLFGQPNTSTPSLAFSTTNSQVAVDASNQRSLINAELSQWASESATLGAASQPAAIDTDITASLAHLAVLRTYCDTLLQALGNAVPTTGFSQASITSAQASVGSLRDTINTLILSIQGQQQQISSDTVAIQAATDGLQQTSAGSTAQDIAAQQANVDAAQAAIQNINAQMKNGLIIAPYAGTVTSVAIKPGQIATPDSVAIALAPESALQVVVYLTEVDVAKLSVGAEANVTLDAYGSGRIFPARVVSIDRSPTMQGTVPAYKTVLQFTSDDPAISSGMTANATIVAAQKSNALVIPRSSLITNGSGYFVLVRSQSGRPVQKQVQLGLVGTSTAEVTAGLSAHDQFLVTTN